MKEIEIKLPLKNPGKVILVLDRIAQVIGKNIVQKGTYYVPKHRDFLSETYPFEWLRIRETDKGAVLNYKHFYPENVNVTDYCDEFQTKIEDAKAMKKILASLDFKEIVVVEKTRHKWLYKDVKIAVDEVKELGWFIELEAENPVDPKETKEYLRKVLEELEAEVGEEDLRGYPFMVLNKRKIFNK